MSIGVVVHLLAELWQYLSICWKLKKLEVEACRWKSYYTPTLCHNERNNERVDRLVDWRCRGRGRGMLNDRSRLRREHAILCQQLFDLLDKSIDVILSISLEKGDFIEWNMQQQTQRPSVAVNGE